MQVFHGKSVLNGIAIGKISVYKKENQEISRVSITDADAEFQRYEAARQAAISELQDLYEKAVKDLGEENAAIFEMHQMMLDDGDFNDSVENIIREESVNAEYAVASTRDTFAEMFASMDDDYMKERAADVKDISERLLKILSGAASGALNSKEPVILLADDLAPSETVQLDKDLVLSFVTVHGALNSHTAILARTMSIPSLVSTDMPLDDAFDGKMAIVDGFEGYFYVDPDEQTLCAYQEKAKEEAEKKLLLEALHGKETVTLDGQKVMLYANIIDLNDMEYAKKNDAEGVGLFRSEFIYLDRNDFPSEEDQFEIYKKAAEEMNGHRVVIRTLDIGADKQCDYFEMEKEDNPAMGCRAIRICLTRPEIFKTQLRALLRASLYGKIAIMYPMIISIEEVRKIHSIVEECKAELTKEGIPFGNPEQGIMIETPAAAIMSDQLAKEVDFFSIGTNDLSQYTLAIDRTNTKLDSFYDAHHPALLRQIEMVAENAHKAGIWVGICGELGADQSLTKEFLRMGIDELSVAPGSILPIRKLIRECNVSEYKKEAVKDF